MKTKKGDVEQQIDNVLMHQQNILSSIQFPPMDTVDDRIGATESFLSDLGIEIITGQSPKDQSSGKRTVRVPTWAEMCAIAEESIGTGWDIEDLFSTYELQENRIAIQKLKAEYNQLHRLDAIDIGICVICGLLAGAIDILLVGMPQKTPDGLKAKPLSNFVREWFNTKYPADEMEKLAHSKTSKVPFDAQDNRHTTIHVEGLSAYYHRLLSLGHDPLLGFIFGVYDILNGTMTTIDKKGKFVIQVMENYADRKESEIFAAIAKLISHFASDITTSMGLPVPLMSLFSLLQVGHIGDEDQTIAEIVQGMYYEGYDFVHFCSMSLPVMIIEVVVRLAYSLKRIKEGHRIAESIPFSLDHKKHPKLPTELFIAHSVSAGINAGKILFTQNPLAVNYPQWISFAKYSYSQLKWCIINKPSLREAYVRGFIQDDLKMVYNEVDRSFEKMASQYTVIF